MESLFATLAGTGMRCGEAFGLHVQDIDLATGRIYIRRSVWNGRRFCPNETGLPGGQHRTSSVEILTAHFGHASSESLSDSQRHAILQGEREAQAEPDSQATEFSTGRAPCFPPWSRLGTPKKGSSRRFGERLGGTFQLPNSISVIPISGMIFVSRLPLKGSISQGKMAGKLRYGPNGPNSPMLQQNRGHRKIIIVRD